MARRTRDAPAPETAPESKESVGSVLCSAHERSNARPGALLRGGISERNKKSSPTAIHRFRRLSVHPAERIKLNADVVSRYLPEIN